MSTKHKIRAYLYDNLLTENPDDFVARVSSERSLNIKDICQSAVTRGGADISAASMEHAVGLWLKEMGYLLCDSFSVNADGWFTASAHIKGVFDSPSETFNPAKHTILFSFNQGSQLRKELDTVTVDILGVADALLSIVQVIDVKTASINDLLTPNHNLRISGSKLKIAGGDPANGVYFVNQDTQMRAKVDASDMVVNNPSELIIMIPNLTAGTYKVEVVTQYAISSMLKEPRSCVFDRILTVQ